MPEALKSQILYSQISYSPRTEAPWPSISDGAKDAVRRMMTWHPGRRPAARQMLRDDWVLRGGAPAVDTGTFVHAHLEPDAEPEVRGRRAHRIIETRL